MSQFPKNLRYTKDHEWALKTSSGVRVGITDHAQGSLGDVVHLELPAVGKELKAGDTFGVVESVKAVSDLYAPVSGKVVRINSDLVENPSSINTSPYDSGWLIEIELKNAGDYEGLLTPDAYESLVKSIT